MASCLKQCQVLYLNQSWHMLTQLCHACCKRLLSRPCSNTITHIAVYCTQAQQLEFSIDEGTAPWIQQELLDARGEQGSGATSFHKQLTVCLHSAIRPLPDLSAQSPCCACVASLLRHPALPPCSATLLCHPALLCFGSPPTSLCAWRSAPCCLLGALFLADTDISS